MVVIRCCGGIQYWRKMFVVKIDVIIAVYNAEATIEECVRSAINQEIPNNLIQQLFSNDACLFSNDGDDNCKKHKYTSKESTEEEDDIPVDDYTNMYFDICICCYNDASTDKSLDILYSLQRESIKQKEVQDDTSTPRATIQTKLLVGTAPTGTTSRGAGYARNQAIKLRDDYEKKRQHKSTKVDEADEHFLCILDSDDLMHPTRIAEQTCAMLSISGVNVREKTLMGCQFKRIPKDSTHHYTHWANSLSDERLYLEQFRECTLLQPTWFLSKTWLESLGGYVEAPISGSSYTDDAPNNNFYRLVHPSEATDITTNTTHTNTLRLAEDTRLFYAHLHAGGKLHLHRTKTPLVTYRHRSGMCQSSNTPRRLLLRLRAKAWEDMVYKNNALSWTNGFAVWGAGRDGKDFIKALSHEVAAKVVCFVDVDQKKIETVKWYENPVLLGKRKIPILHFSVLSNDSSKSSESFGHIDKRTRREDTFNIVSKKTEPSQIETVAPRENKQKGKKKDAQIDSEVLQQLPVVVCVAMYRTNGALEANVKSIDRTEGKDLWHII